VCVLVQEHLQAMERTVEMIEADISAVKKDNGDWTTNAVDLTLLAALINEKIQLQGKFSRHFVCLFVCLFVFLFVSKLCFVV
jgi:hypothetical protein